MKKLLIISDNERNIALFNKYFKKDMSSVSVPDAEKAYSIAKDNFFDIVISDILIDASYFPDSEVISSVKCENAYFIPEISEIMLEAISSWIELSSEKKGRLVSVNNRLQKKIDDISIINRAKFILMKTLGLNENEAHKYIEKKSMEMRISKSEIAKRLLKTYE